MLLALCIFYIKDVRFEIELQFLMVIGLLFCVVLHQLDSGRFHFLASELSLFLASVKL